LAFGDLIPCGSGVCESTYTDYCEIDVCVCNQHYTGEDCTEYISICSSNPCQNGGSCDDTELRYDRHVFWTCDCTEDYSGYECDQYIDLCDTNPCDKGVCNRLNYQEYECICDEGFTGENCDTKISSCDPVDCNLGQCFESGDDYVCICDTEHEGVHCDTLITQSSSSSSSGSLSSSSSSSLDSSSSSSSQLSSRLDSSSSLASSSSQGQTSSQSSSTVIQTEEEEDCPCVNGYCMGTICICGLDYEGPLCEEVKDFLIATLDMRFLNDTLDNEVVYLTELLVLDDEDVKVRNHTYTNTTFKIYTDLTNEELDILLEPVVIESLKFSSNYQYQVDDVDKEQLDFMFIFFVFFGIALGLAAFGWLFFKFDIKDENFCGHLKKRQKTYSLPL
jgi:hypothetical protein